MSHRTADDPDAHSTSAAPGGSEPPGGKPKIFYGWYLVGAGAVIQLLAGMLVQQPFSAYAAKLSAEFGWSRGAIGAAYSVARVEAGVLGPLQGWMIDRWGPRAVMQFGIVLFAIGFMLFSQIDSLWMFYASFGLVAIGSSLGGFMAITVAMVNWFDRYRSRALGISSTGMAVGGLIAPLVILAITNFGWRETAFASGVAVLVIGLPATHFFKRRPEEIGLHVDGLSPDAVRALHEREPNRVYHGTTVDYTAREAMKTRAFWMISLGHGTALLVVGAVMVHIFIHLTESFGYSDTGAATIIFIMTASQVGGQVVGGYLGDIFSKRWICVVCMLMHGAGLFMIAQSGSLTAVIGFAVLHGFAWGTRGPLMQALRADYFGRTYFGVIMGWSSMVIMFGQILGPILAGVLYDMTGSYQLGFTVIAILAALGGVFFILAKRPDLPNRPAPVAAAPDGGGPAAP